MREPGEPARPTSEPLNIGVSKHITGTAIDMWSGSWLEVLPTPSRPYHAENALCMDLKLVCDHTQHEILRTKSFHGISREDWVCRVARDRGDQREFQ